MFQEHRYGQADGAHQTEGEAPGPGDYEECVPVHAVPDLPVSTMFLFEVEAVL